MLKHYNDKVWSYKKAPSGGLVIAVPVVNAIHTFINVIMTGSTVQEGRQRMTVLVLATINMYGLLTQSWPKGTKLMAQSEYTVQQTT